MVGALPPAAGTDTVALAVEAGKMPLETVAVKTTGPGVAVAVTMTFAVMLALPALGRQVPQDMETTTPLGAVTFQP